jgi:1-acyl-sn-glycerol-3-phosphate acyltransferase
MPRTAAPGLSTDVEIRAPFAYRVAYTVIKACLILLFRFEVTGRDNVPGGPYVAVANHLHWLDAFAILFALPRDPRPHLVGWDTVALAPKLWWLIKSSRMGFVAVPRDPQVRSRRRREVQEALGQCLRSGYPLALFPEGSVGLVEGRLAELRPGFAGLALATGAPVVPIALSGTRNLWLRKKVRIAIGAPISPGSLERSVLVQLACVAMEGLMPPYAEPKGRKLLEKRLTCLIPSLTNWTSSDL